MFYFIHIFYHLQDNLTEVCVSSKKYIKEWEDWGYQWYKDIAIIAKYDKRLLKYIECLEDKNGKNK